MSRIVGAVTTAPATGRPRDSSIDDEVLRAALAELATKGYSGFSIAAVAQAAGTTRPAVYRRWPDKSALCVDAVARLAETSPPEPTGEPHADLVAELEDFAHCIRSAGALPIAGLMLGDEVDPGVRAVYLERVVAPRRARLRAILGAAIDQGLLDPHADLEVAGSFLTGSWYSFHIAGAPVPQGWARRVADLVWAACSVD